MNLRSQNSRQSDPGILDSMQAFSGLIVALETTIATAIVVGLFEAATRPFGWSAALQFVLCAGLGLLLCRADAKLQADDSFSAQTTAMLASHRQVRQET
jgi:hypothetical protein